MDTGRSPQLEQEGSSGIRDRHPSLTSYPTQFSYTSTSSNLRLPPMHNLLGQFPSPVPYAIGQEESVQSEENSRIRANLRMVPWQGDAIQEPSTPFSAQPYIPPRLLVSQSGQSSSDSKGLDFGAGSFWDGYRAGRSDRNEALRLQLNEQNGLAAMTSTTSIAASRPFYRERYASPAQSAPVLLSHENACTCGASTSLIPHGSTTKEPHQDRREAAVPSGQPGLPFQPRTKSPPSGESSFSGQSMRTRPYSTTPSDERPHKTLRLNSSADISEAGRAGLLIGSSLQSMHLASHLDLDSYPSRPPSSTSSVQPGQSCPGRGTRQLPLIHNSPNVDVKEAERLACDEREHHEAALRLASMAALPSTSDAHLLPGRKPYTISARSVTQVDKGTSTDEDWVVNEQPVVEQVDQVNDSHSPLAIPVSVDSKNQACNGVSQLSSQSIPQPDLVHTSQPSTSSTSQTGESSPHSALIQIQNSAQAAGGSGKYACESCSRRFARPSALAVHAHMHTGAKPFTCKVCQRSFSVNSNLRRHLRTHSRTDRDTCATV